VHARPVASRRHGGLRQGPQLCPVDAHTGRHMLNQDSTASLCTSLTNCVQELCKMWSRINACGVCTTNLTSLCAAPLRCSPRPRHAQAWHWEEPVVTHQRLDVPFRCRDFTFSHPDQMIAVGYIADRLSIYVLRPQVRDFADSEMNKYCLMSRTSSSILPAFCSLALRADPLVAATHNRALRTG